MSRDWESDFKAWSQGPGKTEQERAENAEVQVRQAIQASEKLKNRNIKVFTQGSYKNRVNVRQDSREVMQGALITNKRLHNGKPAICSNSCIICKLNYLRQSRRFIAGAPQRRW